MKVCSCQIIHKYSIYFEMKKYFTFILLAVIVFSCESDDSPSCPQVRDISFFAESTSISIQYNPENNANSYRIEYGQSGFSLGNGTQITTSDTFFRIEGLEPSTTYDIYVTSICSAQDEGRTVSLLSVTTDMSECSGTPNLNISQFSLDRLQLNFSSNGLFVNNYEIEYGIAGFDLGMGTIIETDNSSFQLLEFQPETTYDFYLRANCSPSGNDYSSYTKVEYTTLPYCPKPTNLNAVYVSGTCTFSDPNVYQFSWSYISGSNVVSYTVSLSDFGDPPTNGNQFTTSNESINIQGLFCTEDDFYVRANCDDGSVSEWAGPVTF